MSCKRNQKFEKVITDASQAIRNLKRQNKTIEERTKFLRKQICEGKNTIYVKNVPKNLFINATKFLLVKAFGIAFILALYLNIEFRKNM